jgi:tetratricopeptide (TPR) repeat protein
MSGPEREAFQLGRQCFERGDPTRALGYLTRVLDSCPRFADVHYLVGLVQEDLGNGEAAIESFEAALRINPGYAEARLALASSYERAGDFDGSRALAEQIGPGVLQGSGVPPVEAGSPDPITRAKLANLHAGLGDAYCEVGDFREAVEAYRKALERCPTFHDIRQRLGIALREAGLGSQALEEFRRILRANPTYLDAAVQLGLTLYTMGRSREAIAEWKRVVDRDPSREAARMYLSLLERAGPEA